MANYVTPISSPTENKKKQKKKLLKARRATKAVKKGRAKVQGKKEKQR